MTPQELSQFLGQYGNSNFGPEMNLSGYQAPPSSVMPNYGNMQSYGQPSSFDFSGNSGTPLTAVAPNVGRFGPVGGGGLVNLPDIGGAASTGGSALNNWFANNQETMQGIGQGFSAFKTVGDFYMMMKNYGMQKDAFKFQKQKTKLDLANSARAFNNEVDDQQIAAAAGKRVRGKTHVNTAAGRYISGDLDSVKKKNAGST